MRQHVVLFGLGHMKQRRNSVLSESGEGGDCVGCWMCI
jgi:hypothetical protein